MLPLPNPLLPSPTKEKRKVSSFHNAWLFVLTGLNNSIKYLDAEGLKLHEYNYSDVYLQAVMKGMDEVTFDGVSVKIILQILFKNWLYQDEQLNKPKCLCIICKPNYIMYL